MILAGGELDAWDGWKEDAESDDFQVCFTQITTDGWDWENLCTYASQSPEKLACGAIGDNAALVSASLFSAAAFTLF